MASSSLSLLTSFASSNHLTLLHYSDPTPPSTVPQWLHFIFLSPYPQRVILTTIDIFFLLVLVTVSIHKLCSRTHSSNRNERAGHRTSLWFKVPLVLTTLVAISYAVLSVLSFTKVAESSFELKEAIFRLVQTITYFTIAILLVREKRFSVALRIYWIANFVMVVLFSTSAVLRLSNIDETKDFEMKVDDIFSLIFFPISLVLLVAAIKGYSGATLSINPDLEEEESESALKQPLLSKSNIAGYASASLISRAMWNWMNPLLEKGYKSPLDLDDIPSLSPEHDAGLTSKIFESNWPKPAEKSSHPVRLTLFRSFWKELIFTAFLAIVRLCVMYIGPVLLQDFVNFSSGKDRSPYQGCYLVATLLISKIIEVLSAHQFNFQSQKAGMLMRSSLITALHKKGLRISSSARQAHGVGQIVNYMSVDAQQLSDMVLQLHNVWLMPCQVLVALTLLYTRLGVSAFAALATLFVILALVMINTARNKRYQFGLMMMKDTRMKATTEMLNNMRVIKFQAWEEHFNRKIKECRELEYNWLTKFMYSLTLNIVVLYNTPVIVATVTFGIAVLLGFPLDAGIVFTAAAIFRTLQEPINSFPQALMSFTQAMVALGRLDKYFLSKELVDGAVEREEGCGGSIAVEVKDGVFSWDDEDGEPVLKNLNLMIKKGELTAIVGTVGSGKSSLLASILGEMHKISGKVRVCGTTAYVAQTSWIQNGTIQENVLFGSPINMQWYKEVIKVCSLDKDLEMMEFGDQTEIGERGINLSGGQKQRIQLARAVYQDCDIYLLDDVFSAVDAHTGSELFKECVRGVLKDKTILLVTHQVDFLHNADRILVMRDGMIVQSGKYDNLLECGLDFGVLVAAHNTAMELVAANSHDSEQTRESSVTQNPGSPHQVANGVERSLSRSKSEKGTAKLIQNEERESGQVSFQVYKAYGTEAYGWWGVVIVLLMTFVWTLSLMVGDLWLAFETGANRADSFNPSLFISVYAIVAAVSCVLAVFRNFIFTYIGLKTAQIFFYKILASILHAPMSFFDTTPSGRILTRASMDQVNLDMLIPFFIGITIIAFLAVFGTIAITCVVAWPTVILVLPLLWINIWYRGYYLTTTRELTRLSSITSAPVIHHFSESITGVMTVRAFKKLAQFSEENIKRVNANLRTDFHNNGCNEWLGFRLELFGSFFLCFSALFMVVSPKNWIKPEYVGLSLSYGLSLNGVIFFAIYMSCFVENRMISVERIMQFINIPFEAPWKIKDTLLSPDWPTYGDVDIKDLQVRYRPNTPLILKGLSLKIQGGEKIGVVGRTGSGKSTLIQALFRVMEPSGGKIIIDGVDILKLGLHDLRSRFGIIPQEPVLFQGTVRSNVDPIGLYSDEDIWKSLESCRLKDVVSAKPDKLDTLVVDGGDNWSVGQRQLLCLGRVLLKRSRILFMDEATASVDSQTDGEIQKIIREEFAACTIISIAHRIPTVMDCDKVLVIDAGRATEFDKPSRLLERVSLFAALVNEYANRSSDL